MKDTSGTPIEEWRPIPGIEPVYEVSNLGNFRSWKWGTPKILAVQVGKRDGYRIQRIVSYGKGRTVKIHQLVLAAFQGPRPEGYDVRHLDGDRLNNRLSNLAYGTRKENMQDQKLHGTNFWAQKTHCPSGHPYSDENTYVAPKGGRYCRACAKARQQRDLAKNAARAREKRAKRKALVA